MHWTYRLGLLILSPKRTEESVMSVVSRAIIVWLLAIFLAPPSARAQDGKFGEVNFPISCSPAAQTQLTLSARP